MITTDEILKKIEESKNILRGFGVKKIGLFGSYVRNEQREGSDIDILVEFEKDKKTFDNYIDLKLFLEDLFKYKVDLVIYETVKTRLRPYIFGSVKYATGL
ncbi:MAG: nucleotidyltransferase family protein [Halobacteriota archaeon]